MITRKEAIEYGLSFPNTYVDAPFRDPNWQLIRVKESKKVFLWIYEKDGFVQLNVKVEPEWRDFLMTNYRVIMEWVHDEKIKYLEKRKIEESASE